MDNTNNNIKHTNNYPINEKPDIETSNNDLHTTPSDVRIFKYHFGPIDRGVFSTTINYGKLVNILSVQEQNNLLVMWASVDVNRPSDNHEIRVKVCWTGDNEPDPYKWIHWETIQTTRGLVYHVYRDLNS